MKVANTSSALNDNFYPEATGKLVSENADPNALAGVMLSVDDLGYIKQGNSVSGDGSGFEPTQAQLDAMNSGITSEGVAQIETNKNNISLKQDKTWVQLKNVTTTTETFELDLHGKSEVKLVLIYNQINMYEASAPINLINAGYKLIVSHVDSNTPTTDIGTFVYNFSAQGTDDFTATIPSTSYSLRIFAR